MGFKDKMKSEISKVNGKINPWSEAYHLKKVELANQPDEVQVELEEAVAEAEPKKGWFSRSKKEGPQNGFLGAYTGRANRGFWFGVFGTPGAKPFVNTVGALALTVGLYQGFTEKDAIATFFTGDESVQTDSTGTTAIPQAIAPTRLTPTSPAQARANNLRQTGGEFDCSLVTPGILAQLESEQGRTLVATDYATSLLDMIHTTSAPIRDVEFHMKNPGYNYHFRVEELENGKAKTPNESGAVRQYSTNLDGLLRLSIHFGYQNANGDPIEGETRESNHFNYGLKEMANGTIEVTGLVENIADNRARDRRRTISRQVGSNAQELQFANKNGADYLENTTYDLAKSCGDINETYSFDNNHNTKHHKDLINKKHETELGRSVGHVDHNFFSGLDHAARERQKAQAVQQPLRTQVGNAGGTYVSEPAANFQAPTMAQPTQAEAATQALLEQ